MLQQITELNGQIDGFQKKNEQEIGGEVDDLKDEVLRLKRLLKERDKMKSNDDIAYVR